MHYQRLKRHGELGTPDTALILLDRRRLKRAPVCVVEGCDKPNRAKGYCNTHWWRMRNWGHPGPADSTRRPSGAGCITKYGYVVLKHAGRNNVLEHRMVMERMMNRPLLKSETVHHLNGVRDDNRPANLELMASSHPRGQRVEDLVEWAKEILARYGSDFVQPRLRFGEFED